MIIDYAQNSAAYRFILTHENGVFGGESRDVKFFENVFSIKYCASRMLAARHTWSVITTSTSNNENIKPR